MGDIIDNIKAASNGTPYSVYRNILDNAPTVESIPKADYESLLRADMVALLEELRQEIDIMSNSVVEGRTVTITSWRGMQKRICNLIQSKIDKLEGEDEE